MKEIIKVEGLSVQHKKTRQVIVKDVSFSISSGASLVLLGQSGSGKTMTCNSIMGLLNHGRFQVTGKLSVYARDLLSLSRKEKQKLYGGTVTMIPQNPMTAFNPSVRIGRQMKETLRLHSALPASALEERVKEALIRAGLDEPDRVYRSYPFTLSGGMLQRVLIAMALMVDARLIVADEPTTALDVANRNATVDSFIALREQGSAVLLVTHDFSVAAQLGGELLIMKDSEIIERGTMEDVLMCPKLPYTKALIEASLLSGIESEGKEEAAC